MTRSSQYYSLLHCDKSTRAKIHDLRHIYAKLSTIKPIAAEWWYHELSHKHPDLLPLLNAFLQDSTVSIYPDDLALHEFYRNTAGYFETILYQYVKPTQPLSPELALITENLGIFNAKINHLCHIRQYLEKGKLYLSGEQLINHQVNLYELSKLTLTDNIKNLFKHEIIHINNYYYTNNFNSNITHSLIRPTWILAHINKALLTEIEKSDFPVLTEKISLTPLYQYWIALWA